MTAENLVELARNHDYETLEQLWDQQLAEPGDIVGYRKTVEVLCENDMASRALAMTSAMVDALEQKDRKADAAELAMALVRRGAHNDALAKRAYGLFRDQYASEPWFDVVQELAGLDSERVTAEGLERFEKMRCYTVGNVLYHRAGWGEGLVEEFHADSREVVVRFTSGMTKELPLSTALDSLTPLAPDDLRCMMIKSRDELERLAAEEPSVLIRKAAQVYRGTITSTQVKGLLSPAVIPQKKWASFWKRAKAAAAADPWLQVEGSTTRPVFQLRRKPLSLADEARRSVMTCDTLGEQISVLRGYIERSADPEAAQDIFEIVQERIEAALRPDSNESHAHILDGILLLERYERSVPAPAATELRAMLLGEDEKFQPRSFDKLATQDAREHAVQLIPDALGETWIDTCVEHMTDFPATVVENVVNLIAERKFAPRLLPLWDKVAPYPRRHPFMTYLMGRLFADSEFDGAENAPSRIAVARVLLHLARTLSADRRGSPQKNRLLTRVVSLLTGRRNFLQNVLEDVDRDNLAAYLGITERGGEDFPQEISSVVLRAVADKYPELTAKPDKPFWESDAILTTAAGLEQKREEYRVLVEVKIPENSRAIGVAASHGDLSENSEWDAAMEEQRNLTSRASQMEDEIRRAKLIEDHEIPDGVVAPGTRVTYKLPSGDSRTVKILGPWDTDAEGVINYLAPIAQPLLGLTVGEIGALPHPDGEQRVEITGIEKL